MPTRITPGAVYMLAALALFLVLWFSVIIGQHVLLGGDAVYSVLPWSAEPGAHPPANFIVSDPILQMLPWQEFTSHELSRGRLPLWNPFVQGGAPFLSSDQPAVFSPFNLFALPFPAAVGLSLAMLAKLLVAAIGMALYLRKLKAGSVAAVLAGVAYASSSFMVVWLAWPHAAVAALMPWAFLFAEMYLSDESPWALPGLAVAIALQFLAGHAETSLHLALALGIYVVVRVLAARRWRSLVGLAIAAFVGTMAAGIQVVPFLDLLRTSNLVSDRAAAGIGFAHLGLGALTTWVFPNAIGNPAIDGAAGHPPNFSESTGFATVTALVLSPFGLLWAWQKRRSVAIALACIGLVSAGVVYGPLVSLSGHLPFLSTSNNQRMLVAICFAVAALGGLGLEWLLQVSKPRRIGVAVLAPWLGLVAFVLVCAAGIALLLKWQGVDSLLPHFHAYIGFWLAVGAATFAAAGLFAASILFGTRRRIAAIGLCSLALIEAAMFAGPFNPREQPDAVPPPSAALSWLQAHSDGQPVAALGSALIPETYMMYGLNDVRGYEVLSDPRERIYWSTADPGYDDSTLVMFLNRPGADWLAAAGVRYVLMSDAMSLPGTSVAYSEPGVAIAEVPSPRPFIYAATSVETAQGSTEAAALLARAPLGPVVVEGCCPEAGSAQVKVLDRVPGSLTLRVVADSTATIVIEQSFRPGWEAEVDGRPVTILPANVLYQAVIVTAGEHTVTLSYSPRSVTIGEIASAIGIVGLILLAVIPLAVRQRRQRA